MTTPNRRPPGSHSRRTTVVFLAVVFACVFAGAGERPTRPAAPAQPAPGPRPGIDWPSFRGISASGVAEGSVAARWNVPRSENVLWKTPIPGLGHSSPVVWGGLVCVATAVGEGEAGLRVGLYGDIQPADDTGSQSWKVYCLDKQTGTVAWERTAHAGVPRVKRHTKATHANSTLAMDGRHVVALFGSEGLHAFDTSGKPLWKKDLGILDSGFFRVREAQWGFGSSPVIHDGAVYVQADVQEGSFLAAFDVETGRERWRTPRSDVPTWSTPTIDDTGDTPRVVVNGWKHIGGYDALTGKELWRMTGGGDIPVPTPVVAHGLAFITNAHGGSAPIYAVRTGARGDVTLADGASSSEHVAWSHPRDGAYMQTPVVYGELLFVCRDNGVLSLFEAKTGRRLNQVRLGDGKTGFTASAVAADGRLYYTSEEGDVHVVRADPGLETLGVNPLGELSLATPAVSEGVLYFRTRAHLVAVAEGGATSRGAK
jgi:outer membrane protein assembly factor BamB